MNPLEIQFELKKRGVQQKHIAADLGISDHYVSMVIRRRTGGRLSERTDRIMRAVSAAIGVSPEEAFPEIYPKPPEEARAA